ncbi:hypothetical protein GCM10027168_61240 [Streptomyces capparidis]
MFVHRHPLDKRVLGSAGTGRLCVQAHGSPSANAGERCRAVTGAPASGLCLVRTGSRILLALQFPTPRRRAGRPAATAHAIGGSPARSTLASDAAKRHASPHSHPNE